MGNAEGDFRGDNDVILTAAINGMTEDEFKGAVKGLGAKGVLERAGLTEGDIQSKFDLITQLDKVKTEDKVDLCEALKAGENPFDEEEE